MCVIFGYVGKSFSSELLIEGIRRLEYKGYDSWGVAAGGGGVLQVHKSPGKISAAVPEQLAGGDFSYGIAHTRWATHGAPNEINAHPHTDCAGKLAVVHNGIIENYRPLRQKLEKLGHIFKSETDSETIVHLVEQYMKEGLDFRSAFFEMLRSIEGTYSLAMISADEPGKILIARMSSPLVIGRGEGFNIVASDPSAIVPYTRHVVYMEDGECAVLESDKSENCRIDETPVVKEVEELTLDLKSLELGGFKHFMEKEISDQPNTILDAMRGRLRHSEGSARLGGIDESLLIKAGSIKIIACGTSWHAGLVGKYMFESIAGIPTEVCYAAEFRYSNPALHPDTLAIAISQSGETADTLAGVSEAKRLGCNVMGIVNSVGSTIARECGKGIFLHAGPEIGVASTKAFTSQVIVLALLALQASRLRRRLSLREGLIFCESLQKLSSQVSEILQFGEKIKETALQYSEFSNVLYIGRLYEYPLALEGALKLKETSYVHAEGISAAELKHGPIALIDKNMPVVVLAAQSTLHDKMVSNVNEIKARGGRIISIVREGTTELDNLSEHLIRIPSTIDPLVPVLGAIPLQLFAYHIAVARGCDVDNPRNLTKSVMVE